ncbi:Trmt61a, partial [Symbiodinium microadriaticum]
QAVAAEPAPEGTREGDFVILWGSYTQVFGVVLKHGDITNNRFGNFHHDEIIGRPFGSKVRARKGGLWLALLRPTPEFITQSLTHRTQIVYHADISMLRCLLDARPGRVICEAGTGSGSVSSSLARALRPGGPGARLYQMMKTIAGYDE